MDEYEKSESFAAAASMAHVTKSTAVAVVKKKTTNKKTKKVVKKTRADYFLDEALEWIDHGGCFGTRPRHYPLMTMLMPPITVTRIPIATCYLRVGWFRYFLL